MISGLSVHATFPYTCTGFVHVFPWSLERMNEVENAPWSALRNAEYTSPVSGTTSIVGSYCALAPRQTHIGCCWPQVLPPSSEIVSASQGVGQCLGQVLPAPYRVVSR